MRELQCRQDPGRSYIRFYQSLLRKSPPSGKFCLSAAERALHGFLVVRQYAYRAAHYYSANDVDMLSAAMAGACMPSLDDLCVLHRTLYDYRIVFHYA